MNRNLLLSLTVGVMLLLSAVSGSAAEVYFVQPGSVKLYAEPFFSATVLGVVSSGYQFSAIGKQKNWYKLEYKGKTAYLPIVQAGPNPPLGKSLIKTSDEPKKLSGRSRASANVVVAGVKGLTYEDRARASKDEKINYDALDRVDAMKVTAIELMEFIEGGKQ
jgi:uncharacterized protein YgiM (DUF1202 family)